MAEFVIEMHLRQGLLVPLTIPLLPLLGPADVERDNPDDDGKEEGILEDGPLCRSHGVVVGSDWHVLRIANSLKIYMADDRISTTSKQTGSQKGPAERWVEESRSR